MAMLLHAARKGSLPIAGGLEPVPAPRHARRLLARGDARRHRGRAAACHRLRARSARSFFRSHDRRIEQQSPGGQALELALLEQADHAVLAVVAGSRITCPARNRAIASASNEEPARAMSSSRNRLQDAQLRPERRDRPVVALLDRLARRPARHDLRQHFRQRHQVGHLARRSPAAATRLAAVGEHLDPVLDPDRDGLRRTPDSARRRRASPSVSAARRTCDGRRDGTSPPRERTPPCRRSPAPVSSARRIAK